jgi:phosphate starvation-inducible PhoH-like protein
MKFTVKLHSQLTEKQASFLQSSEPHALLTGPPGTAKTYTACAKGLIGVKRKKFDRIIIIRSAVSTRPIGFLPGDLAEKQEVYAEPYIDIFGDLTGNKNGWKALNAQNLIEFTTTSHLRGVTFDDAYVILDEVQNCDYHECRTVATRVGEDTSLVVLGDSGQSDLTVGSQEHRRFLRVFASISGVNKVEFTAEDIVRSDFVRKFCAAEQEHRPKKLCAPPTEDEQTSFRAPPENIY